jgi:hypothetical protein
MSKFEEKMETFFNIEPSEKTDLPSIQSENRPPIAFEDLDKDLKNDYEKTRETLDELIEKGKHALDDILSIARESERGRDFEVAATMMKTVVDANEKVMDLHKKIREISNYKQQSENNTTIKNAVFVGSTTELAKMVKDLKEKDITP